MEIWPQPEAITRYQKQTNKNPSPKGAAYKKIDIAKNFQVPQMVSLSEAPEREVDNLL